MVFNIPNSKDNIACHNYSESSYDDCIGNWVADAIKSEKKCNINLQAQSLQPECDVQNQEILSYYSWGKMSISSSF